MNATNEKIKLWTPLVDAHPEVFGPVEPIPSDDWLFFADSNREFQSNICYWEKLIWHGNSFHVAVLLESFEEIKNKESVEVKRDTRNLLFVLAIWRLRMCNKTICMKIYVHLAKITPVLQEECTKKAVLTIRQLSHSETIIDSIYVDLNKGPLK